MNFFGHILDEVTLVKYLGVATTNGLGWSAHTDITTNQVHSTLQFFSLSLRGSPGKLKEIAYINLMRWTLEYAATIWDNVLCIDTSALEKVRRKAARFVKHDYYRCSSVTSMLHDLGWKHVAVRGRENRLAFSYKITHDRIAVRDNLLNISKPVRQIRAKHTFKCHIPRDRTT